MGQRTTADRRQDTLRRLLHTVAHFHELTDAQVDELEDGGLCGLEYALVSPQLNEEEDGFWDFDSWELRRVNLSEAVA